LLGDRYKICVDGAFPRAGAAREKFVGPMTIRQRLALRNAPMSNEERNRIMARHNGYVSLRQAAEWGMRALQGTFSRLKTRITSMRETRALD